MSDVGAQRIVVRSHNLKKLDLLRGCNIGELVIDCKKGYVEIPSTNSFSVGTIRFSGNAGGSVSSAADKIDVTGNNINLSVKGQHSSIIVSGNNCSIALDPSCDIGSITVLGSGNAISTKESFSVDSLNVYGSGNNISLDVNSIANLNIDGSRNRVSVDGNTYVDSMTLAGNENLASVEGDSVAAKAEIKGTNSTLTVNSEVFEVIADGNKNQLNGTGIVSKLILRTMDFKTASTLLVEYLEDSIKQDVDRILKLVSDTYQGDFTLKWAQEHDYETFEKEIWVNAKGYSSNTEYLVWINVAMQRVNIFQGSKGNWSLIRSFIVGTGAPGMDTPKGEWYLSSYRHTTGWYGKGYHCRPVVGFRVGYSDNYAFHSRLYYPGTTTLCDDRIGFPVSHGCIRMYDEDVWYMYDNMPVGTKVVVH